MYEILSRDVRTKDVERLASNIDKYDDAQRLRVGYQKKSSGKFVYIKKS
jgi:hypothetical protein